MARDQRVSDDDLLGKKRRVRVKGIVMLMVVADSCSCNGTESAAAGGEYPDEIDFTTKA